MYDDRPLRRRRPMDNQPHSQNTLLGRSARRPVTLEQIHALLQRIDARLERLEKARQRDG